jgi:phosphopantothenoylcysteine decarboxylase/phosphopantothenate--cysteine ligase
MNCIVTAGPTFEPLDDVRRLTNFSTGRLGTELANHLTARGHKVTLLIGELATYPGERRAQSVKIFSTTASLRAGLKSFSGRKVDAVFHAAAVSDFGFGRMFKRDRSGQLKPFRPTRKISTHHHGLLVELVPTLKIIAELRGWFPKTKIIGWKYEADGDRDNVLRLARIQIASCGTDFCVANGPAYGRGFNVVSTGGQSHFTTSAGLFKALEKIVRAESPAPAPGLG